MHNFGIRLKKNWIIFYPLVLLIWINHVVIKITLCSWSSREHSLASIQFSSTPIQLLLLLLDIAQVDFLSRCRRIRRRLDCIGLLIRLWACRCWWCHTRKRRRRRRWNYRCWFLKQSNIIKYILNFFNYNLKQLTFWTFFWEKGL